MATRKRAPFPVTFPGVQEPVRSELERFARTVREELDERSTADVRPLSGSTEPLGPGGVYYFEGGAIERALPNLEPEDAGKTITIIRRDVGTALVYATSPSTISGATESYLPPRLGAYVIHWDGTSWWWAQPPGLQKRHEFSADQLREGPFPVSLGASGVATLIGDPQQTGVMVRGFGAQTHNAIGREFFVPTGTQGDLTLRTYYRAQSGPTGHAVVNRLLHARQYEHGSGVPSGWTVYTLPGMTLPSGVSPWRYQEDRVPLRALGLSHGRVEVVLSRPSPFPYQSPDLDSMLLVESITLEIEA